MGARRKVHHVYGARDTRDKGETLGTLPAPGWLEDLFFPFAETSMDGTGKRFSLWALAGRGEASGV